MTTRNLFFIDSRVADRQTLIGSLPADSKWHLLDADEDGIEQMLAVLANYGELESIQIVSHGAPGTLYLGSSVLDNASLDGYSNQLASLGNSLTETGDILLYGCNVAEGEQGQQFVATLAQLTGADVAASADLTGSASLGGNWVLETRVGQVDSAALAVPGYARILETLTGTDGDDYLWGTAADDVLSGAEGVDTLYGGEGSDILDGGAGNDTLDGGDGADTYLFAPGSGQDTIVGT